MRKKLPLITLSLVLSFFMTTVGLANNETGTPANNEKLLPLTNLSPERSLPMIDDTLTSYKLNVNTEKRYHFPDLDAELMSSVEEMVNSIPMDDMNDLTTNLEGAEEVQKGMQTIEAAQLGGTRIDDFDDLLNITLPAYRIQQIGNIEAIIVINSLRLESNPSGDLDAGGRLGIYVGVKIPQKNYDSQGRKKPVTLIFGTEDLGFTHEGGIQVGTIGLVGDTWFELGGSSKRSIVKLRKHAGGESGTYIKFGCDGLEEFGIGGDIYFTREWVMPADADGVASTNPTDRVKGEIQVVVQDWNNMLITTSLEKFVLSKFKDVSFELGNCSIDLSDFVNPPNLVIPYEVPTGTENLWRGVHIETFELTFPKPFKKKCDGNYGSSNSTSSTGCRLTLAAENLLIDPTGVSGLVSVSGLAPMSSGALMDNKWSWSLDEVQVGIISSKFDYFSFSGGIVLPIAKKETPLTYTGSIDFADNSVGGAIEEQSPTYSITATLEDGMEFPVFKAFNVGLEANSFVNVTVQNDEFKPVAVLNGYMSVGKPDDEEKTMEVPKLSFTDLRLSTTPGDYLSVSGISLEGGGSKLNKFPVQISNIGLIPSGDDNVALKFTLGLQLMPQSDGGLSASGDFEVLGNRVENIIGAHEWKYSGTEMTGFDVLIDLPMFKGCGSLNTFEEDPIYGKGFSASLDAHVMMKGGDATSFDSGYQCGDDVSDSSFTLQMAAVFGNQAGMRYFMVDGYAEGDAISVPLAPTPLKLNGFGGGVQYRMKLTGYQEPSTGNSNPASQPGVDASGLIYTPDPATLFGIKFAVGITTVGDQASAGGSPLDGKLNCIIRFGPGLSLQNITFWGTAELINPKQEATPQPVNVQDRVETLTLSEDQMHAQDKAEVDNAQDKIMAKLGLSLDFDGGFSMHGFAEVKVSAAGGNLKGLGQLDLLIDPNSSDAYPNGRWHLFVGGYENEEVTVPSFFNPEDEIILYPVSVSIDYGELQVAASAYFLMGNDIPGPPDINAAAASFFEISTNANEENRELLDCGEGDPALGTGIAFGASLLVNFEKKIRKKIFFKKVTILSVKVNGGAGFDIALLQYGDDTTCDPALGISDHGLNGFRATGTIWAYINVHGKVLGVPILPGIGAGVLLEADIPNPSYFKALVVLKLFKKFEFNFDIGDQCGHPCSIIEG